MQTPSLLRRVLVVVGGGALLLAMAVDALAVVGRHTGIPLLGSIEIVQAAVLVSGGMALLMATLAGVHARVHLLVDRAPPLLRDVLARLGLACGAVLYLGLLVADLWSGFEESELLRLPYRPLRVFTAAAAFALLLAFLVQALGRRPR